MRRLLPKAVRSKGGFTLIELLVVVLIVGILAAVGVPLYLGYVRDSRLAEAKALAGSVLTAAQACAQQNPGSESSECTLAKLRGRIGLNSSDESGDGKWKVTLTTITVDTTNQRFAGGPININGTGGATANMATAIFFESDGKTTVRCKQDGTTVTTADGTC